MVTGDNATSKAVPSLMTVRVSLRETLGPKKFPGWTGHPDLPTACPNALPWGVVAGSSRGRAVQEVWAGLCLWQSETRG